MNCCRGFLAVCLVFAFTTVAAATEGHPNILLILADDLGYSDLGSFGGEIPTPNLDRLASGGLRFTTCYNSARCCPSRASLMTGLYPHQTGIGSFATARPDQRRGPAYLGHLNEQCVTLAEVLGEAGYQRYMVGKWHMEEPGPIARGFEEFFGYVKGHSHSQWDEDYYIRLPEGRDAELDYQDGEFYATDAFSDYALNFLDQARQRDDPWFLYVAHSSPHFPLNAPKESIDKFVDIYRKGWDVLREQRFERMKQSGLADDSWTLTERAIVPVDRPDIANGYPGKQNPAWSELPEDRREDLARRMATFAAMVWHVDQGVGRILASLEANGELDNTLILFTSDNGACYEWGPFGFDGQSRKGETILHQGDELAKMGGPETHHSYGSGWANLGNTPLRLYKHFTHEGGVCSPLLAHWPKGISKPDRWVTDPVHLFDIMPTLRDVAKAKYPEQRNGQPTIPLEGTSLMPVFKGDTLNERTIAFEHQEARAIRKGNWKAVWSKRMPHEIEWELYDLSTDRVEAINLATSKPDLTESLATAWMSWAEKVKVYPFFEGAKEQHPRESRRQDVKNPSIAGKALTIACDVDAESKSGVILAQGGVQQGYALHIEDGKLCMSVRIHEKLTVIQSKVELPSGKFRLDAQLDRDGHVNAAVDGRKVLNGKVSGPIPIQPIDPLSIGFDDFSNVGSYTGNHKLKGTISNVRVTTE